MEDSARNSKNIKIEFHINYEVVDMELFYYLTCIFSSDNTIKARFNGIYNKLINIKL